MGIDWVAVTAAMAYILIVGGVWGYALADERWWLAAGCIVALLIPFVVTLAIVIGAR